MSDETPTQTGTSGSTETDPEEAPTTPTTQPSGAGRAWRTLVRMGSPRATKANLFATLLAVLLGFAIATTVRQTELAGLENLREDELVRILDNVTKDGDRLAEEVRTLEGQKERLGSGAADEEARRAAEQRLDNLGILSGTMKAAGPGIILTIQDPSGGVTAPLLLDTLQELRDAGAEAVQINDVRVVASTYFTDTEGGISVSGRPVKAPYVFTAIGDSTTLASAMAIPGGVSETVRSKGGEAVVRIADRVEITALQPVSSPEYARPVPAVSPTG